MRWLIFLQRKRGSRSPSFERLLFVSTTASRLGKKSDRFAAILLVVPSTHAQTDRERERDTHTHIQTHGGKQMNTRVSGATKGLTHVSDTRLPQKTDRMRLLLRIRVDSFCNTGKPSRARMSLSEKSIVSN